MNKQKLSYLSPETETLVVRFEGSLMINSPLFGVNAVYFTEYLNGGDPEDGYEELN